MFTRARLLCLGSLLLFSIPSCGADTQAAFETQRAARTPERAPGRMTLEEAPASLRASTIASIQADAGFAYDLVQSADDAFGLEGELLAQGVVVRYGSGGAAIAAAHDDPADVTLRLEAAGCRGEPSAVAPALPEGERNRARYAHTLAGGGTVEAWYVSGPLGLEQGFTVSETWGCAGELEVVVAVDGASVEAGPRDAEARIVGQATGTRYRYGELYAHDAGGTELAARMEVREGRIALLVDARGAAFPITIDPLIVFEQAKLTTDDPEASADFGTTVALSGDTALVGAHMIGGGNLVYHGSAYVFVRVGEVWTEQAKLTVVDGGWFGSTVALSGDTALVGDFGYLGGGETDAVYVFVRSGSEWSQQARLTPSDAPPPPSSIGFSYAVALSGDTAIATARGAAYVFQRSGAIWTEQAKLFPSVAVTGFGTSVALVDDTAIVGVQGIFEQVLSGSAYVFVRAGSVWSEQAKLVASDAEEGQCFGYTVALSPDTAIVGAPCDAHADGSSGSAYVFAREDTTWSEQAKLTASDAAPESGFGSSLAMSSDTLLVGGLSAEGNGQAYVFQRSLMTWSEEARFGASDAAWNDSFARSVSLSGDTALLGASNLGATPGSAYVVHIAEGPPGGGGAGGAGGDDVSGTAAGVGGTGGEDSGAGSTSGAGAEDGCGCRAVGRRAQGDDDGRGLSIPVLLGVGLLWRRSRRREAGRKGSMFLDGTGF